MNTQVSSKQSPPKNMVEVCTDVLNQIGAATVRMPLIIGGLPVRQFSPDFPFMQFD